jgi:predicted thioredoxin/glutaredoxin
VTEVLNQAGLLDSSDNDSQSVQVLNQVKERTRNCINNIRSNIHQNISLDHIRNVYKNMMEEDRMGTCGLTTGVVAGLIW